MAFPPTIPPNNRANTTDMVDVHAADHNAVSSALTDIVTQVNPSAWTALPYGANWTDLGAGYQVGQYRKIGDIVYLRGSVMQSATASLVIATFPVGFRPLVQQLMYCGAYRSGYEGVVRVDIYADGRLLLPTAPASTWGNINIHALHWSVT
jgi:hypothetical protein